MSTKRIKVPACQRALLVRPATADIEAREVDVAWSTGAIVQRYSWAEDVEYEEELVLEGARLDRFNTRGGPFLNAHRNWDLDDVLGRTILGTTRLEDGECRSRVKFSQRPRALEHLRDMLDGVSPEVSVRYWIYKVERIDRRAEGKIPLWRVVDWEPFEISGVPIAADGGAGARSESEARTTVEIDFGADQPPEGDEEKERKMPAGAAPAPSADTDTKNAEERKAIEERARAQERERVIGIRSVGGKLGIAQERVDSLIADGTSLDEARAKMIDEHADNDEPKKRASSHVAIEREEKETESRGWVEAILHRANPAVHKLTENGRRFQYLSLVDLARDACEARGINTRGRSPAQIAQEALHLQRHEPIRFDQRSGELMHTTGDFTSVLLDVMNKSMRMPYEEEEAEWRLFCKRGRAKDFRAINAIQMSEFSDLEEVNEHGEYKAGTVTDGKESYRVVKRGKTFRVAWEVIVNDDLSVFTKIPAWFGGSGRRVEADVIYGILTTNAPMGDNVALFHASRGNLGTAGTAFAPNVDGVKWAKKTLRKMKGPAGKARLGFRLKFLIVPEELDFQASQVLVPVTASATTATVPEKYRRHSVISEPRLDDVSAQAWYGCADPAQTDTIEYAYLDGYEGVTLDTRVNFNSDGFDVKGRHIFGAKALEPRAFLKNDGVSP